MTMSNKSIPNIETVIQKYVGANKKVVKTEITDITKPGENYSGVILEVKITLKENGNKEIIHGVAKTPDFDVVEFFQSGIPAHYKKEVSFYKEIVPTIQHFYKEEGLGEFPDIFPKLYAARFNLTDDEETVDKYAFILLENLITQGYQNIDRHIGFDLDGAKLVLKDLAVLHAVPIALKLKKPSLFDMKIREWADNKNYSKPRRHPPPKHQYKTPHALMIEILREYEDAAPYIHKLAGELIVGPSGKRPGDNDLWTTVGHNDLWTNNTMQKIENGKVTANKLIDFQMLSYQSPVKDVLFFLSTSLQFDLLDKHFDDLIKFYHQEFVIILEKFNCDTKQFDWLQFEKELNLEAGRELGHIAGIIVAAFGKKGEAVFDHKKSPSEMDPNAITLSARKRVAKIINMFGTRGWL